MDIYQSIEKHLNTEKGLIGIRQGRLKLRKAEVAQDRYNFNKNDVEQTAGSIKALLKSLPAYGFTDGTKLQLRKIHGSSTTLVKEITLSFSQEDKDNAEALQGVGALGTPGNQPQAAQPQPQQQQQNKAMGETIQPGEMKVTISKYMDLTLKEARYEDIKERNQELSKKVNSLEAELDTARKEHYEIFKKYDLSNERHQDEIKRVKAEAKPWTESETVKEAVGLAMGSLPQIIERFAPAKGVPAALGSNPKLSPLKNQFAQNLPEMPEDVVNVLYQALALIMKVPTFKPELQNLITITASNNNNNA